MKEKRFNVRVYAIIRNTNGEILVSDERRNGFSFTKFPGGGLEWGEGIRETVRRELSEELGIDAQIGNLIYVNDFFQVSAFHDSDQLLSFYYEVTSFEGVIETTPHNTLLSEEGEYFRWIRMEQLSVDTMTFPIDKMVVEKLKTALL